jgi:hypothetical protein
MPTLLDDKTDNHDWKYYTTRLLAVTIPALIAAVGGYYKVKAESNNRTEVEYQTLKGAVDNLSQALANTTASIQVHTALDEQRETLVEDQIRTLSKKIWAGHHRPPESMDVENAYLDAASDTKIASKADGGVLTLGEIVVEGKPSVPVAAPKVFNPVKLPATLDKAVEAVAK